MFDGLGGLDIGPDLERIFTLDAEDLRDMAQYLGDLLIGHVNRLLPVS
jgi:hypothetical protein